MERALILGLLVLASFIGVQAQIGPTDMEPTYGEPIMEETPEEEVVFKIVEDMPDYPGGEMALMKYLSSVVYPEEALNNKYQGTPFISFIIEKDGSISNALVARSSNYEVLDNAALEHIKAMPNWNPGTQRGQTVRVEYVIPIKFKL